MCETAQFQVLEPLPVGVEQINLSAFHHSVASERRTQTGGDDPPPTGLSGASR